MATRSNGTKMPAANAAGVVKKGPVCCLNCEHALLHRYGKNPVLASCVCQPQQYDKRFPYVVEVASCMRHCFMWKESKVEKVIEQRKKTA